MTALIDRVCCPKAPSSQDLPLMVACPPLLVTQDMQGHRLALTPWEASLGPGLPLRGSRGVSTLIHFR